MATLTTNKIVTGAAPSQVNCDATFDQQKMDVWWASLYFGFEYVSWGESNDFSSWGPCSALLPSRPTPTPQLSPNPVIPAPTVNTIDEFSQPSPQTPDVLTLHEFDDYYLNLNPFTIPVSGVEVEDSEHRAIPVSPPLPGSSPRCSFGFKQVTNGIGKDLMFVNCDPGLYPAFARSYEIPANFLSGKAGIRAGFEALNNYVIAIVMLKKSGSQGWYFTGILEQNGDNPNFNFDFDSDFTPSAPGLVLDEETLSQVEKIAFKIFYSGRGCEPETCEGDDRLSTLWKPTRPLGTRLELGRRPPRPPSFFGIGPRKGQAVSVGFHKLHHVFVFLPDRRGN